MRRHRKQSAPIRGHDQGRYEPLQDHDAIECTGLAEQYNRDGHGCRIRLGSIVSKDLWPGMDRDSCSETFVIFTSDEHLISSGQVRRSMPARSEK